MASPYQPPVSRSIAEPWSEGLGSPLGRRGGGEEKKREKKKERSYTSSWLEIPVFFFFRRGTWQRSAECVERRVNVKPILFSTSKQNMK